MVSAFLGGVLATMRPPGNQPTARLVVTMYLGGVCFLGRLERGTSCGVKVRRDLPSTRDTCGAAEWRPEVTSNN